MPSYTKQQKFLIDILRGGEKVLERLPGGKKWFVKAIDKSPHSMEYFIPNKRTVESLVNRGVLEKHPLNDNILRLKNETI